MCSHTDLSKMSFTISPNLLEKNVAKDAVVYTFSLISLEGVGDSALVLMIGAGVGERDGMKGYT